MSDFLRSVRALLASLANGAWPAVAALLDSLGGLNALKSLALAGLVAAAALASAWLLQRSLVRVLVADPKARPIWWRLELACSLPGLLWLPFGLLVRGVRWLAVRLGGWRKKGAVETRAPEPGQEEPPLLVASLGPTFLLGGIATAALYLLSRLGAVLLRARMGLPDGAPAWQILFLGHRPELGLFLPLDRYSPWAAALLAVIFWTLLGWWMARAARVFWQGSLGRNLIEDRDRKDVLEFWREKAGAPSLARPDASYTGWAGWVVAAGVALFAWTWLSLDGDPFRVRPSEVAVAFVVLLFWAIHLVLRGLERLPAQEKPESETPETQANGWNEVLAHLQTHLQVASPLHVLPARRVEPLAFTRLPPEMDGVVSPLVLDLLPGGPGGRLTEMQRVVLTDLSLQSFVHVEPPVSQETLELAGLAGEVLQDRSRLRHRNQIVLAPESAGKTTLALLAAANHVLVHTRGALLIARDDAHEERLYRRINEVLRPSAVRWNLRVRQVGGDLMNDLARGIVPDVVVCSLQRLVMHLLGNAEGFTPFLRSLGLIVVDDVESYCGPVEVHAQLAFRRLAARLRHLQEVEALGEKGAPLLLALGADSLHDLPAWARSLCGVDAVTRDFTRGAGETEERETAEGAARGLAAVAARPGETKATGNLQLFHRLRDFRTAAGELLDAAALVEVCERLAVPWTYRPCGDLRRHLGRQPLLLKDEPRWHVDSPEDACVIFLEGRWSDVRRERRRLRRAGARFCRQRRGRVGEEASQEEGAGELVAFVTLADADEEMAFTQLDRRFGLAGILERLPEPALRPPSGRVTRSHLAADLVQHWMEVAEVVNVFGHGSAPVLRQLARGGLLLTEPRVDVHPDASDYVRKVYVRALARATAPRVGDLALLPVLPTPVAEVELVSPRSVAVRDRTKPAVPLARVDASASAFLYYPGRIFADARGSFLVVGRALTDGGEGSALEAGDVLVEPVLTDDVSSPRRRVEIRFAPASSPEIEIVPPEPVLFGRHAVRVGVLPVEVRPDHRATLRVGPFYGEERQRLVRRETGALSLHTIGLWIEPGPDLGGTAAAPALTFGAARLIAAAFRVLLPNMVRGASESLEVALRVDGDPEPGHELRPGEGFLIFDLDEGGSGTARSLLRDGVEPLLRLGRLLLERVLDPSRLLALHDHWADAGELVEGAEEQPGPAACLERHAEVRRQALIWLDSRLRPEGRAEGVPGASGQPEGAFQAGEGDAIDLGRCWFSDDGSVSDLVWAKHRWRVPGGGEAMLDVAFDRPYVAVSRDFANHGPFQEAYRAFHAAVLALPERRLADGTVWGAPRAVLLEEKGKAVPGEEGLQAGAIAGYHPLAEAIAAFSEDALGVLAETLRGASGAGPGDAAGRLALLRYLAGFVQGIPYSIPSALRDGLRPPVSTLLYRLGDCDSKSLLLALLARSCGVDAGLFVSFAEGHALAAVSAVVAPDAWSGSGESSERPIPQSLMDWCALAGVPGPPRLWAEMPESTESGAGVRIYVPVESTVYSPLGRAPVSQPRTWAFLPLTVAPLGLPSEGAGVERKDEAELEDRA